MPTINRTLADVIADGDVIVIVGVPDDDPLLDPLSHEHFYCRECLKAHPVMLTSLALAAMFGDFTHVHICRACSDRVLDEVHQHLDRTSRYVSTTRRLNLEAGLCVACEGRYGYHNDDCPYSEALDLTPPIVVGR